MQEKRRDLLMQYLKNNKTASMDELCKIFDVSKSTIRRDIDELESQNFLKKVYGGVILVEHDKCVPLSIRKEMLIEEKDRIGEAAAKIVNDEDIIFIDAGTTTVQMLKYLKHKTNITIITNSILVVNEAIAYGNFNIILTGGNLLLSTNSINGPIAVNTIKNLNCKSAFVSATGVSLKKGLSNSVLLEAEIKRQILKCASNVILLVDHTKFDLVSLVTFSELNNIDTIITDDEPSDEYREYFRKTNIKLIIVK